MDNYSFLNYWRTRHERRPEVPDLSFETIAAITCVPYWTYSGATEVLTEDGVNNPLLYAPIRPGVVIVKVLKYLKMSQSDLAQRVGVSRNFMSLLIRGERPISVEHAVAIQDATNIPAFVLLRMQADCQVYEYYKRQA